MSSKKIARVGIYAAIYAALTIILSPISYGPIQVRVSEFLTLFPFIDPLAIPGVFIGCIIANLFSPGGWIDIILGSLFTLVAAYLTQKMPSIYLTPIPPILINAFGISLYLHTFFKLPYLLNVIYIGVGEGVATYGIGLPILLYILKKQNLKKIFENGEIQR
ncbi:MAG TPA: QueT transporter family protein [Dictyoglomaceae bacterium]|nr:QueT transporter family protein [Dictyoglomaceae bacterium]HOL39131.1 QueT transporter family protein [Dictyoglomaceae bacterium]HOP94260.1 QueT transporter family protein [Dictyoglomaceae bacterium]HPP15285.1 QueT transporter family protein [Dictyoglomaceae bacterium]HPU42691.1 QueT transporter family protein [Dictyoglomaceae bacterium]